MLKVKVHSVAYYVGWLGENEGAIVQTYSVWLVSQQLPVCNTSRSDVIRV